MQDSPQFRMPLSVLQPTGQLTTLGKKNKTILKITAVVIRSITSELPPLVDRMHVMKLTKTCFSR
jgi:hypothetical protein